MILYPDDDEMIEAFSPPVNNKQKDSTMIGYVYTGVVVRTVTVPIAEGVNTGVQKSEIVFMAPLPWISLSDENARAELLAGAIAKGVKTGDPATPVEAFVQRLK